MWQSGGGSIFVVAWARVKVLLVGWCVCVCVSKTGRAGKTETWAGTRTHMAGEMSILEGWGMGVLRGTVSRVGG